MYDSALNILDQAALIHGPRNLLARYIAYADDTARELGVRLRFSRDFDRLLALNRQHADSWPALPPLFDPKVSTIAADSAFFVEGIDDLGDTVVTSAARLYDHGDRSLAADLRSLRVFYDDPAAHLAAGETVEVTTPTAEYICGRVTYSGAVWVRPDFRRHGFTKIVPRLTRSYAMTQWNTPMFWMVITQQLDQIGVTRAYGSWHIDGRIAVHMPALPERLEFLFGSMGQDTLIRDIAGSIDHIVVGTSRWMDNPIAKTSPLAARQGISTRS
jgi:hypothetical protein